MVGNTLLVRQGSDIAALDVTQEPFEERGLHPLRISGAASLGLDGLLQEMFAAVEAATPENENNKAV